jgi:pimeloyl-ACP methyl ester carboxylesterase
MSIATELSVISRTGISAFSKLAPGVFTISAAVFDKCSPFDINDASPTNQGKNTKLDAAANCSYLWFGCPMKTRAKIILGILASLLVLGPFAVPVNSSGTLAYQEAAAISWEGRSEFVNLADHDNHIITAGNPDSDRLIVLLHGFGASSLTWQQVLEPLGQVAHIVAYDRAAFGFTERPTSFGDLNPYSAAGQLEVIDGLVDLYGSGKEVIVLGHSAGGALALGYALDYPNKIDRLILEAPAVYGVGGTPQWMNWIFSIPQLDHLGPLLVSSIASSGLSLLDQSYTDPTLITNQILDDYTAPLEIKGWERAFWEFNKAPRSLELVGRLDQVAMPTLIITGDDDRVVATSDSVKLSGEIEASRLEIIPNSGHLPNEEKPQLFTDAIISFLGN